MLMIVENSSCANCTGISVEISSLDTKRGFDTYLARAFGDCVAKDVQVWIVVETCQKNKKKARKQFRSSRTFMRQGSSAAAEVSWDLANVSVQFHKLFAGSLEFTTYELKKNEHSCVSTKRPKVNPHVGSWSMFLKRNHLAWLIGRLAPKMEELRKHRCRRAGGSHKTPSSLLVTQYMSPWRCSCIKESTTEKLV